MKKIYLTKLLPLCMGLVAFCVLGLQAQVNVTTNYTSGIFDNEVAWSLYDVTAGVEIDCYASSQTGSDNNTVVVPTGNTIEVFMWESFGDGWDGATLTVSVGGNTLLGPYSEAAGNAPSGNGTYFCTGNPQAGLSGGQYTLNPACGPLTCPGDLTGSTAPGSCAGGFVTIPAPGGGCVATNDFNGTADASGNYPKGVTTVTWTAQTVNGTLTCSHTVTITDQEPPQLDCPGSQTIALDGGECNQAFYFDVVATDNCPNDPFTLTGPFCDPCADPTGGSALACSAGPNSVIQIIGGTTPGDVLSGVCFNQETFGTTNNVTVNVYCYDGVNVPYSGGGFTALVSENFPLVNADNGSCVCFTFSNTVTLPAGCTSIAVEFVNATGRSVQTPPTCDGNTATGNNSYLVGPACGITTPALMSGVGFSLDASFAATFIPPALVAIPSPTAPPGYNAYTSGDLLPIGIHCFLYEATDAAGNSATCDWCVTVSEYQGPYANLSCNANINVSVDENCEAIICADQVLEGGLYKCYDNYNVTVIGLSPPQAVINNGTSCVTIKASQLDGWAGMTANSFAVSVSDPNDANNSCWNDGWMIEDKYKPTIECPDPVTIACEASTEPGQTLTGTASGASAEDLVSWADGVTGDVGEITVSTSGVPIGAVASVTVDLQIDHSWTGDLQLSLEAPDGTVVSLIPASFGCTGDNVNATFDDNASNGLSCGAQITGGPHEDCPDDWAIAASISGPVQPAGSLASIGGYNGDWKLSVFDEAGGDGGCISQFTVNVAWTLFAVEAPTVFENCGQYTLVSEDEVTDGDCGDAYSSVIERTWTATDQKGNSASCTQIINVEFASLDDVICPINWDGLPGNNPMLDCSGNGWIALPNGNPSPETTGYPLGAACGNLEYIYTDLKLPICEGSYKIYRTWTILDWCAGGDAKICNQTIKVMDSTGPAITCPTAPLEVSTTNNSCEAVFFVQHPAATDNCSSSITWTASISAGNIALNAGQYVVTGLAIGTHTITWIAEDNCGNKSTCLQTVIVSDDVVPAAICETFHVLSLTTGQPTLIYATTFDDGSHDNCAIEKFEVRRMTPPTPCINFDWTTDGPGIDEIPNGLINQRDRGMTFWYPAVPFACCDVGGSHLVEFRVTDVNNNSNTCMVTVEVDDKLDPVIQCPDPQPPLACSNYINQPSDIAIDGLNQNGLGAPAYYVALNGPGNADNDTTFVGHYANAYDNCEVTVYIRDTRFINNCGISTIDAAGNFPGPIQRFFTAVDGGGRTDVCVQLISVINSSPYPGPLSFPNDATLNSCDALTDPAQTGSPNVLNDNTCSQVAVTHTDLELPVVDGACKKILRTWYVIDWCTYNPNANPVTGYWTDTQIIKVLDLEGPTITSGCEEQFFSINTDNDGNFLNGCTGPVTLTIEATDPSTCDAELQYEYWIDVDNDGTQDIGTPFGANTNTYSNATFQRGTHKITWTVEDACGNITTCAYLFHVEDNTPPYMFYAADYITELVGGVSVVWATEFQGNFGDECSDICDFRIQVPSGGPGQTAPPTAASHTFTAVGTFSVDWWIKDCANNWAYVTGTIQVQDNNGAPSASISGGIATETGDNVNNVTVDLTGNAPGMDNSILSNDAGAFAFNGLPLAYNYTVTPGLNVDPLNGVSTYDLVLISKHILNIQELDSPYKRIAADINNSGSITTFDMVELRKLILFINTEFQNNTSWRFVEADYVFSAPNNPWATSFPELSYINGLTIDEIANYVAIKVGDVNGSAIANSLVGGEDRTTVDDLVFRVNDQKMVAGEEYTVEFNANDFNNVMGYQFTLSFDQNAVEFVDINAGNLTELSAANFGLNKVNEGVITTSWNNTESTALNNNEVVFSVTFKAKSAVQLSNVLSVSSRYTVAEAYNAELELMGVAIEYNTDNGVVAANDFDLYQNTPNPFKNETVIGFSLPEATTATMKVYDVSGRVLKTVEGEFAKGYNEVTLNRSDLSGTGVLYYTLETATDSATKKMIIVE